MRERETERREGRSGGAQHRARAAGGRRSPRGAERAPGTPAARPAPSRAPALCSADPRSWSSSLPARRDPGVLRAALAPTSPLRGCLLLAPESLRSPPFFVTFNPLPRTEGSGLNRFWRKQFIQGAEIFGEEWSPSVPTGQGRTGLGQEVLPPAGPCAADDPTHTDTPLIHSRSLAAFCTGSLPGLQGLEELVKR